MYGASKNELEAIVLQLAVKNSIINEIFPFASTLNSIALRQYKV
jgi:hypothetical protein